MLESLGILQVHAKGPAKGIEDFIVVEQEDGEEVVTGHILTDVVPVMNTCQVYKVPV